jgi:hypothetical protein
MNSIEELQNLVELMKQALKFYADKNNYIRPDVDATKYCVRPKYILPIPSKIELDGGSQAQFTLDLAKKIIDENQKIQDDYDKIVMDAESIEPSDGETNPIDLIKVFLETHKYDDKDI